MGTVTFKDVPILGSIFYAMVFVNIVVIPKGKMKHCECIMQDTSWTP